MKNRKTVWACLSIRQLKQLLAVAEELQKKHGLCGNDADAGIYAFSLNRDQLSLESVRAVATEKSYLPTNLMPVGDLDRLMPYTGEYFTAPFYGAGVK